MNVWLSIYTVCACKMLTWGYLPNPLTLAVNKFRLPSLSKCFYFVTGYNNLLPYLTILLSFVQSYIYFKNTFLFFIFNKDRVSWAQQKQHCLRAKYSSKGESRVKWNIICVFARQNTPADKHCWTSLEMRQTRHNVAFCASFENL